MTRFLPVTTQCHMGLSVTGQPNRTNTGAYPRDLLGLAPYSKTLNLRG